MNIDISIHTIIRGEANKRQKSIAFEIFINNKAYYREAFIPDKKESIGNSVNAELLAIQRALTVSINQLKSAANINILIQQKEVLNLLNIIGTNKINNIPLTQSRLLRLIYHRTNDLDNLGCTFNYIQKTCAESTIELCEYRLLGIVKKDIVINNIQNTTDDEELISENQIDIDEKIIKICEVKNECIEKNTHLSFLDKNEHIDKISSEIKNLYDEEAKLDEAIASVKHQLSYLKAYKTSIYHLNSLINDENNILETELSSLNKDLISTSQKVDIKKINVDKNCEEIATLNKNISNLERKISKINNQDMLMIRYLKKQIERLVLEANLPFAR